MENTFPEVQDEAAYVVDSFDKLINFVDEKLMFRGYSLKDWYVQIQFPTVSEHADKEEVAKLNSTAIIYSEIIYRNVAVAKATLNSARAKHIAGIQNYKVTFLDELEKENKRLNTSKRAPSSDILDARAHVHCKADFQVLTLAEIVYDFWKYQVDKLQVFNSRITSLNISKHNDDKYSNNNM